MINADLIGINEMTTSVERVYKDASKRYWGFSIKHFEQIIELYSEFVKMNKGLFLEDS
jgi:predicted SPOUT superfamily RNA methylase MTH1